MEMIKLFIDIFQKGIECMLMLYEDDLNRNVQEIDELCRECVWWNMINCLFLVYIEILCKDQQEFIEQGIVVDWFEFFLKGVGNGLVKNFGKVFCGYQWVEVGCYFKCVELVDGSGLY